ALRFIVVDELHAFIGTERGIQLQSLLRRLEAIIGRATSRIGLSATLGDMRAAAQHLRPTQPDQVVVIESAGGGQDLRVEVRAYLEADTKPDETVEEKIPPKAAEEIAKHLFERLRGSDNLIFAGSRQRVEYFADRLRRFCEESNLPNEFYPHHG